MKNRDSDPVRDLSNLSPGQDASSGTVPRKNKDKKGAVPFAKIPRLRGGFHRLALPSNLQKSPLYGPISGLILTI